MSKLTEANIIGPNGESVACARFDIDTDSSFLLNNLKLIKGEPHTLSFWIKSDDNGSVTACGNTLETETEWKRFVVVYKPENDKVQVRFDNPGIYYLYHPKLELGNKPTDWSPNPDDVDAWIQSEFKMLNDQISLMVTEQKVTGNYLISKINLDSTSIQIQSKNINLEGAVSFKSLDADLAENFVYEDGNTIIDGNAIFTQDITATGTITGAKLYGTYIETTSGLIGGAEILSKSIQTKDFAFTSTEFDEEGEPIGAINVKSGLRIGLGENVGFYTPQTSIYDDVLRHRGQLTIGHRTPGAVEGLYSASFGTAHSVTAKYAITSGYHNTVNGQGSVAFGRDNKVSENYGFASGCSNVLKSKYGHVEGLGNITCDGWAVHVEGKYCLEDTEGKYLHIAGNGTSDSNRSNAYTLDWSGNGWFAGNISTDSHVILPNGGAIKGYTAGGVSRTMLHMNTSNNIVLGYGSYANSEGTTEIYGNAVSLYSRDGVQINSKTSVKGVLDASDHLYVTRNVYIGRKGYNDGKDGVFIDSGGYMQIQRSAAGYHPYISFFTSGSTTTADGQIRVNQDTGYMEFRLADKYTFASNATAPSFYAEEGMRIGDDGDTSVSKAIGTYWKDGNTHYIVERGGDGLTASFGWAGSSSYATITQIRGRTCRYVNSSGTTALSDERLKYDFVSLEKWNAFFDMLEPFAFKLKNGSSGRYHFGFKAQQFEKALLDSGLTTQDCAAFVRMVYQPDEDDPEGDAVFEAAGIKPGDYYYGIIYTELITLNTYQIQQLKKELSELKRALLN